ncbi:MAG TPA: ATP-dependent DNA helicase, partial [Casimicrobiaceae bacterium]|nr:ATP-dependent DNA helicase [Casimicrobiaceae bacterium]
MSSGTSDAELAAIFGDGGTLARTLPGFRFRAQQLAMAQAVARAIALRQPLVAEAGTGTGKTFAYLVPALLYGGKVIVSTGTKTLQDQLFERDLPLIRDALAVPITVALLKGRANYVCHHHLERTAREGRLPSREDARHLPKIVAFARASERGDRAELADVPDNASIWPLVTSTRDNCLGSNCAFHRECFVMKARKDALDADVVVVNHHLFFADVTLRDEGLAELLPACNTVILDEAHQLPDTATLFFGEQTSASQLTELARDAEAIARTELRDVPDLPDAGAELVPLIRKLRLAAGDGTGKLAQQALAGRTEFVAALDELAAGLDRLAGEMQLFAERSEDVAVVARRAETAADCVARWKAGFSGDDDETRQWIRWIDLGAQGFQLHASPLSVADVFRRQVDQTGRAWIFTSATLAVGRDFSHYTGQLGLGDAETGSWDSPFDYATQALLYVPRGLPAPNSLEHTNAVVDAALPVLKASGGR